MCEMAAGCANRCVCLCVLIGTGLEYAKIGLSGYEKTPRRIRHLSLSQVSHLMAESIVTVDRLTVQQANKILDHRAMRVQLSLLMGLPGFMDMALDVLHDNLKLVLPQNDEEVRSAALATGKCNSVQSQMIMVALQDYRKECVTMRTYGLALICRQLAGQVSTGVRHMMTARLRDDFHTLGAEVVYRLLLMSLSGVTVNE